MGRVILTFLLTSLFWWSIFTYWAYNKDSISAYEEIVLEEEQYALQEEEPQPSSAAEPTRNKVAEPQPVKKKSAPASTKSSPAATKSAPATSPSTPVKKQTSAPKQEPVAKDVALDESPRQVAQSVARTMSDSEMIVGKWQPVEGAKDPLEFTKYGAVIQTSYGTLQMRYDYRISGDKMKIRYDDATFKILKEGSATYLEIYNSNDFSGRYRLASQPAKINATVIDKSAYPTYIIGKWTPITGQENPIEFTKFNTAIQMVYGMLDMRYEYSLNDDKLSIRYDKDARVVISEDAKNFYLEIFNATDFSGRYKKTK
ncbi:MAG: hypothetical protein J6Q29_00330 [Alistipes sp.]|nr:hypothetical protein [Alistipes sp.]